MNGNGELPSLRGTIRLGGQKNSSKLNAVQIFDVKFYPYAPPGVDPVFAICGGTHVIICRCVLEKNHTIEILRWMEDEDDRTPADKPLLYNSVAWSQAENGNPLICVTGNMSEIKVLNVETGELVTTLAGHGHDINDLAISPTDPTILASCSRDQSVRLWSLDPTHREQPLAAICHGQGHREEILTLAYHRKGRYILTASMDTKINMWTVPKNIKDYMGTDKPAIIHYPHFATTEVHTDMVDCLRWSGDLIFSKAAREGKIILWKIDGFTSETDIVPPAPIPTSSAVKSKTTVTIPKNHTSNTRSAWGGRFQRLLQFDLPNTPEFYMRFSVFSGLGRHPVLVAGDAKSKVSFWDLQRLEKSDIGEEMLKLPVGLAHHIRDESSASDAPSAASAGSGASKTKRKKTTSQYRDKGISDPFFSIKPHKTVVVPKYVEFSFRQFAWSDNGEWCVGVGDHGLINVFHRWQKGVPPLETDAPLDIPIRPTVT
ncbi:WD40 repeat-like protein [Dothidotthia symphoricarpi CBS 119687]|uniref:WD40 repeat-like protein n=1 Tax=Dothidotthia symphoricarpi CBS 119687 TaxID=1392245 RepID=A0A6A5ZZB4_9PLEO|nr:WD40 repeat-like protein [Dothidotthia symphoricarpi CBS 119687]KAF2125082.1 WD40 repeat-like protein [Dothidotthia symphoricarpi CBS 119687]